MQNTIACFIIRNIYIESNVKVDIKKRIKTKTLHELKKFFILQVI